MKQTAQVRPWQIFGVLMSLALLALLAAPSIVGQAQSAAGASSQQVPGYESGPCQFDPVMGWVEGTNYECGVLTVPEQYEDPTGPTIRLDVVTIFSQAADKQPDPLVMLQGGPGGSTIYTYTQILPNSKTLPGNRDIILFDQRGTLYADPNLSCPEFLDLTIRTLDQDLSTEESNQMALDTLEQCRTRLESEGVNLNAFDSLENAADIESLRQAMGFDQINLYGVSYGTLLALHYMRGYPQSLRSVILDSVVPTQTNYLVGAAQTENRAFEALFTACSQDPNCGADYPDIREVFYSLVDRLNAEPVEIEVTDLINTGQKYTALIDGDTVLSMIFQMLYSTELIPFLPRTIYDIRDGDYSFFARIMGVFVFDDSVSYGMYYSVLCAEDADFTTSDVDLSGLPDQLKAYEEGSAEYMLEACRLWNVETLGPAVDEPVQSSVPTLLLTGHFDPITPPEYARLAAQSLSNSYLYEFPAGGHGELTSNDCADNIMLQFLDDPTQEPDAACLQQESGPEFLTHATLVPLPILSKLLNLEGSTGLEALFYLLALLVLGSALLVYPLAGLVRLFKGKPREVIPAPGQDMGIMGAEPAPSRPWFYRLAPWSGFSAALVLFVFTVILIVISVNLALENDFTILFGFPGTSRPLFLLPPLALGLTLLMLAGAVTGWASKAGSIWGRLYLTLVTLAALACIVILAAWGMVTAAFG